MEKILLVEDDSALVTGLKYSMGKEGYPVVSAGGVKDGWREFSAGRFDLIVLDIGLPDGTGFDLCRRIREVSAVPILFLTACDEETSVVMGLDMGGDEFITKPFRLRELMSRIKALLRRSGNSDSRVQSGRYRLKAEECRLMDGDSEIPLTPVECRLVYALMSNSNRTLTRGQLLSRLWDSGGDFVDENTLTVYIRRLREKLEPDPSRPKTILTIRGVGYRWCDGRQEGDAVEADRTV